MTNDDINSLRISPEAARACADLCDRFSDGIKLVHHRVSNEQRHFSFGTLPSSRALAIKFDDLAHGPSGSLERVLQQHIEVITRLRDTFLAAGRAYEETDASTAASLRGVGE